MSPPCKPALLLLLKFWGSGWAGADLPQGFIPRPRPSEHHGVTSLFQNVGGRRLEAEGDRPARNRYAVERKGHHFVYEYAGRSTAGQILNVDHEVSVVALNCNSFAEGRLHLHWQVGAVPGINANTTRGILQPGDVITGGAVWGCGLPGHGFLVEVLTVERQATKVQPTTSVLVRATSALRVVQDIFIDFEWTGTKRNLQGDREWPFEPTFGHIGFNLDEHNQTKRKDIDMGPFRCKVCYAGMRPTMKFKMRTDGAEPKFLSLRLGFDYLNISMSIGLSAEGQAAVLKEWEKISELIGPDLIKLGLGALTTAGAGGALAGTGGAAAPAVAAVAPLFASVANSIELEVKPNFALKSLFEAVEDIIKTGSVDLNILSTHSNYAEVSWDSTHGFDTSASLNFEPSMQLGGASIFENITAGMRTCLGLKLSVFDQEFTSVELCPELKVFMQYFNSPTVPSFPAAMLASAQTSDTEVCIEFVNFRTDAKLDFTTDEPYARACFNGACKATDTSSFSGNDASWQTPLCISVRWSTVAQMPFLLDFREDDVVWDDFYTAPKEVFLSRVCTDTQLQAGCTQNLEMESLQSGTTAQLTVKFTTRSLTGRRITSAGTCTGASFGFSLGVHSTFGGFSYPTTFTKGAGENVVSRVEAPSFRPDSPQTRCVGEGALSAARAMCSCWGIAIGILLHIFALTARPHCQR